MHFVSVLISGIRNWLIHLRSGTRDSKRRCCSPVFLDVAQWTTDKYQKRQRKIFGQGEKPQQKFLVLCSSGSTVSTNPMLSEQTIAKSMAVCIPNSTLCSPFRTRLFRCCLSTAHVLPPRTK